MNSYREAELNTRFGKYSALAEGRDSISISYIASATCLPYNTVLSDLQTLINRGSFGKEAYINYLTKSLVLRNAANERVVYQYSAQQPKRGTPSGGTRPQHAANAPKAAHVHPVPQQPLYKVPTGTRTGGIILLIFGILGLIVFLGSLIDAGLTAAALGGLGFYAVTTAVGAGLLSAYSAKKKQAKRFRKYKTVIGSSKRMKIARLADTAGVPYDTAKRDLDKMADKGYLGATAYVNEGTQEVILIPEAEPEKQPEQKKDSAAAENQYYAIICEIRQLNDEILDHDVSEQIYEIEDLTAKIFRIIEEKPEKQPQIKSFMSYYLPTTLKLLHSYSMFERQEIEGENIDTAKQRIEQILETLTEGFKRQLDQLFQADTLDITTDIDVLESMMKKDGLSDDGAFSSITLEK